MPIASAAASNSFRASSRFSASFHSFEKDDFHDNPARGGGGQQRSGLEYSHSVEEQCEEETDVYKGKLGWLRRKCGDIVDDERTQMFILLLIAINSIMIGMATFPEIKENPTVASTFETVDLIILVIFTFESMAQFFFNGCQKFFKDGWLVFDLIIVGISWASVEVEELKAFRVFRSLRFITRVSVMRNVVVALFSIIPAITAIFVLLLLIFYIYAVMFTALYKDSVPYYFGRMDYTLFTLFQILCLDEWSGIAYEVIAVQFWSWTIFVAFVIMSAFVVVNLLIAVICDALQILRTAEELQKLYGQDTVEEEEPPLDTPPDEEGIRKERLRQRINEMQHMVDEMALAQETMAKTVQYLSFAVYARRKQQVPLTRREISSTR